VLVAVCILSGSTKSNGERILMLLVQLPDGGVLIGEDSQRLQHEQEHAASNTASTSAATAHRAGAQPGTEQWLELRRLLYATTLEAISLKRKRVSSLLVGTHFMLPIISTEQNITANRNEANSV
jgi:hypothetical protein